MKKIIFHRPDGGLSVIHPQKDTHPREGITDDEALERAKKDIPSDALDVQIVDEAAIPADRTFRDAWQQAGGVISVRMDKAREIQKDRLRAMRTPKLDALDIAYMKAAEAGDTKAQADIAAQKQALRDVTNDAALAMASSPEELKAVVPAILQ